MTLERTLQFTRHYKNTIQERVTILISFCSKFTGVHINAKIIKIELGSIKLLQK